MLVEIPCQLSSGPSNRRQWRKVHLGVDLGSLNIRAIEVTGSRVGDAPMLPELLDQIPQVQAIASVRAIVPARSNAQACSESTPGVVARNEIVRSSQRFGRAIWKRWSGYHQRSLVET